jgi:transforming growth factor-beta-induced protein
MHKSALAGLLLSSALLLGSTAATIAQDNPMVGGAAMFADRDIIDNAVNSADHTTLVAAVQAAGLVETLKGEGPFTVLAPVNAAFEALPAGTVESLLKPESKDQLVTILACHVIPARALSTDIVSMVADGGGEHVVDTVGGCKLTLKADMGKVTITDETGGTATVTIADVIQSNGVIHVIDKVLLPAPADSAMMEEPMAEPMEGEAMSSDMAAADVPVFGGAAMYPEKTIVENASAAPNLTTLVAAVQAAGLVDALSGAGPFTVFAPTNDAFGKLPAGTVDTLLLPENKDQLVKVLTAHVVAGKYSAADLVKHAEAMGGRFNLATLSGDALTAVLDGSHLYIFDEAGGAGLVEIADVNQSNGVVHVVDDVLLPR